MDKVLVLSKISTKNLITVPKDVRETLDLKPRDKLLWILEDNKVYIKRLKNV